MSDYQAAYRALCFAAEDLDRQPKMRLAAARIRQHITRYELDAEVQKRVLEPRPVVVANELHFEAPKQHRDFADHAALAAICLTMGAVGGLFMAGVFG